MLSIVLLGCAPAQPQAKPAAEATKPAAPAQAAIQPVKLKVAQVVPPGDLQAVLFVDFADRVTQRTNGAVTFEIFYGGALGGPPEMLDLVKSGAADLAHLHLWFTPDKVPIADFEMTIPFNPTDPVLLQTAKSRMYDEFPEFHKELADNNARIIAVHPITPYEILSKRPITKLDDLKGRKIALVGKYFGRWLAPTGAVPVVAPSTDRYNMYQTGVIDGDILNTNLIRSFKLYEQAKYISDVKLSSHSAVEIIMNLNTWNNLGPEVQKIILQASKEAVERHVKESVPKYMAETIKAFADAGVTTTSFSKDDLAKWAPLIEDTPAEWAAEVEAKGYPGFKILKRWQEITTELGFKWAREWGVNR